MKISTIYFDKVHDLVPLFRKNLQNYVGNTNRPDLRLSLAED